ncbi:MAG: sensor histidine kinase [Solirubrobacteraceae bacterium]
MAAVQTPIGSFAGLEEPVEPLLAGRPAMEAGPGGAAGPDGAGRGGRRSRLRRRLAPLARIVAALFLLHVLGVLNVDGRAARGVGFVAVVLLFVFGPSLLRFGRGLAAQRAELIREQWRAEMAAHLHDSVLQTLALIQKRAGDATEVAQLARLQERELRRWLFEPGEEAEAGKSLRQALERTAAEVEALHRVRIDTVIVGDGGLDERRCALVKATREALTNAAKFAGAQRVDLYGEIGGAGVEVFVRDRGVGFDPGRVPSDRRGVRDSIVARMARNGGAGVVHSAPGEGTEVELVLGQAHA